MEVEKVQGEFEVLVDQRAFYLRPDTPPEGLELPAALRARIRDPSNPLKRRAATLGLTMVDHDIIPSTRRAHQAAKWAATQGRADAMHEAILRRYWSLGEDIGAWPALDGATRDAGLDPGAMRAAVEGGTFQAVVDLDLAEAAGLGIQAVPTFVLGDGYGIEGAQEAEVFRQALRQLGAIRRAPSDV